MTFISSKFLVYLQQNILFIDLFILAEKVFYRYGVFLLIEVCALFSIQSIHMYYDMIVMGICSP